MNLIRPTLSRFARNASMSANPGLWSGLVGAWVPALGVQGASVVDVSGYRRSGTLAGTASWAMTDKGAGLDFDANGERVTIAGLPATATITSRTLVKLNNTSSFNMLVGAAASGNYLGFYLGGTVEVAYRNGSNAAKYPHITYSHSAGVWYDVVFSFAPGGMYLWINGRAVTTALAYDGGITNIAWDQLGNYSTGNGFPLNGQMVVAQFYDRLLTQQEILALYADPLAPFRMKPSTVGFVASAPPSLYCPRTVIGSQIIRRIAA